MALETLAPILQSPLRKAEPLALTSRQLATVLLHTNKSHDPRLPDSEAVRFYALNQMMSLVQAKFTPNEKLPEWAAKIVTAYEKELVEQHKRMVWYTFIVITREFRHLHNPGTILAKAEYPKALKEFHPKVTDSTSEAHLNKWLEVMPAIDLGGYCEALAKQFDVGSYGGGYGGKPWGQIARTLSRYFLGETSAETFIDTAYTLAHNNGPMFNKGLLYAHWGPSFKKLLDVQRSGQVCEGIVDGSIKKGTAVDGMAELEDLVLACRKETGKIEGHVDWYKVQEWAPDKLEHPNKYAAEKAEQDKTYGKKVTKTLIEGKVVKIKAEFEVFPGQTVEVYERLAA